MLDDVDRRIIRQFQADPLLSVSELADRAGVTPSTLTRRLSHLRGIGVIRGLHSVIDWRALGYTVEVSLRVTLDKTRRNAFEDFIAAARDVPEVIEIQTFLGQVDARLSVIARDLAHYQVLYRERLLTLPNIADVEALMHIASVKTDERLPL